MELMSSDASTKSSPPSAEGTSADSASSAFRALVEMFEKMKGHGPYRRYMLERIAESWCFAKPKSMPQLRLQCRTSRLAPDSQCPPNHQPAVTVWNRHAARAASALSHSERPCLVAVPIGPLGQNMDSSLASSQGEIRLILEPSSVKLSINPSGSRMNPITGSVILSVSIEPPAPSVTIATDPSTPTFHPAPASKPANASLVINMMITDRSCTPS